MSGSNHPIISTSVTFASSTASSSVTNLTVRPYPGKNPNEITKICVVNPSTASAMTITVKDTWIDAGGSTNSYEYAQFSVNAAAAATTYAYKSVAVQDWPSGLGGAISVHNDSKTDTAAKTVYVNAFIA
jgi:hypothetical protein